MSKREALKHQSKVVRVLNPSLVRDDVEDAKQVKKAPGSAVPYSS